MSNPAPPEAAAEVATDQQVQSVAASQPSPPQHHVHTLALIPGERRLTPLARQLYAALLRLASEEDFAKDSHAITLAELGKQLGHQHEAEQLKRTLKLLMSTVVEWQSPAHAAQEHWATCGLLDAAVIKKDAQGELALTWRYAKTLREHVNRPEQHASLSLQVSGALRSHAALALYEICLPCAESANHLTVNQAWRWWRPVLTGNPGQHSAQYRYFKRDVLGPAMADINARTDIEIRRLIESRAADNKTVTNIQFEVWPKSANHEQTTQAQANPASPANPA